MVLALGLVGLLLSTTALACTGTPAPRVDWARCVLDGQGLVGVDLTGARLRDTSFLRADLSRARLDQVDGFRSKWVRATMVAATLDRARLQEADFTRANLRGASFTATDLRRARLDYADLTGADLTGAQIEAAVFLHATLDDARWPDGRVCAKGSIGRCE